MKIKRIGLLTSGGDGPGMNAAIRAVVRFALSNGLKVSGIMRGYDGLVKNNILELNHRSVSNIINKGGTILKTARSPEFRTPAGTRRAVENMRKQHIDALVVIGGDGTYIGANRLFEQWQIPTVGIPGTIDNDLFGTDETIGCATAINTALESIDKIRDTAQSMERVFVIEVMGNKSGYIALQVALGSGAEEVIVPEYDFNYRAMYKEIAAGNKKGKISWIIIVAEGAGKANLVAQKINEITGLETRYVVLGHVQRGGTPVATDRILATRLGAKAVDLLLKGEYGKAVGVVQNDFNIIRLAQAQHREYQNFQESYELLKTLT